MPSSLEFRLALFHVQHYKLSIVVLKATTLCTFPIEKVSSPLLTIHDYFRPNLFEGNSAIPFTYNWIHSIVKPSPGGGITWSSELQLLCHRWFAPSSNINCKISEWNWMKWWGVNGSTEKIGIEYCNVTVKLSKRVNHSEYFYFHSWLIRKLREGYHWNDRLPRVRKERIRWWQGGE